MSATDLYEVLELIGRGSFGIIRKVRRRSDGRILVRKEISYHRMTTKEKEQLTAEFGILSQLKHPNIVEYIQRDHIKQDATLHLYMEYCGNGDLAGVIKKCQKQGTMIPEKLIWNFFVQIVLALYRCHNGVDPPEVGDVWAKESLKPASHTSAGNKAVKILHRDLKPDNVLLGQDNDVKLGDFGLSKELDPGTHLTSTYVGTPYYMSPEIVSDLPYTHKSDIWSLGCIIYELCKLSPPFNAKTQWSLIDKIKLGNYPPVPSQYSPELRRLIDWCLKVDPQRRPDTSDLLEMDVFRLLRREHQVVVMNREMQAHVKSLNAKEKALLTREQELEKIFEEQTALKHIEIDTRLRSEWEVRAQEEICKRVEIEVQARFEAEINSRLEAEVERRINEFDLIPRSTLRESLPLDYGSSSASSGASSGNASVPTGSPPRLQFNQELIPDSPADITMGSPGTMNTPGLRHNIFDQRPPQMPLDRLTGNRPQLCQHQSEPESMPHHPPITPSRTKTAPPRQIFYGEMELEDEFRGLTAERPPSFPKNLAMPIPRARQGLQRAGTEGLLFGQGHDKRQDFGLGGRGGSMDDVAMVKGQRKVVRMSLVEIAKRNQALGPAPIWDKESEDCPSPFAKRRVR